LLLVVCGFIEGYISPDPDFPMLNRAIIGFGYGVVMVAALTGKLFGGHTRRRTRNSEYASNTARSI
jgi:hypothetical protein